ncbi:MAG: hypothetical protein D3905_03510, partial [Candidatus Electrothrix sp. AS4_5]|nr:hypothetical protein [Candidatus Electrothrix gigas]
MSYSFNAAKAAFADDQIRELSEDPSGYRFLLLRSLSRAEAMRTLARNCNCNVSGIPARELLQHLYENESISPEQIKSTIEDIYTVERSDRKRNEANLISEPYRIQSFDWGGLH